MAEKHWYLKGCNLFERLPVEELAALETRSRCRRFNNSEVIYLPSAQADAVLALVNGRVKICHITPEGKQSILAFIEPGDVFGEMCLFSESNREDLAIAAEASTVILIPRSVLQETVERHAELAMRITRLVAFRRQRIERRLKYLLFRSNRERLVHLLLELCQIHGEAVGTGVQIRLKLSHQDLASLIGSTRETVTSTLGDLQTEGLIALGRQKVTILSVLALSQSVGGPAASDPSGHGITRFANIETSHIGEYRT